MTPGARLGYRATLVVVIAAATGAALAGALPDGGSLVTGPETSWRAAARLVRLAGAVGTVGFALVTTVLLAPAEETPTQRRASRAAGWSALVWAAGAATELVAAWFVAAPGAGLGSVVSEAFVVFAGATAPGLSLLVQVGIAVAAASCALAARTATPRLVVLALGPLGLAAGIAGGHAADGPLHGVATAAVVAHVIAASAWAGALVATLVLLRTAAAPHRLRERYRALALPCAISVGVTGVVAGSLLADPARLLEARYGWLLLAKCGAYALVLWVVWRASRPRRGAAGHGGASVPRFALGELGVMAFALGLSVVLSQSEPPVAPRPAPPAPLPPPTFASTLAAVDPSAWGLLATLALALPYVAGLRVLARRGDAWPWRRTVPYLAGVVVLAAVTWTGVDVYASALMSVHMLQHMTVNMIVPVLLVLGAPVTLAFRALPPVPRARLLAATRSPLARVVAHPVLVSAVFVGSLFAVYFTPLFPVLMSHHAGHAAMLTHFLVSGFVFFWLVLGVDPDRHRPSGPIRIPLIAASTVAHTAFSVVLVFGTTVIGETWFASVDLAWDVSRRDDQALAGGIAWALGEFVMVGALVAVVYRWFVTAEKTGRAAPPRR